MPSLPDYYSILNVPVTATHDEIREGKYIWKNWVCAKQFLTLFLLLAYKKQALISHPDRLPSSATQEEREEATKKFQLIADAYYILNDRSRRESYDKSRSKQDRFTPFSSAMPNASTTQANQIFGGVFEELLRPEGILF